jgi:hypothetical protein
MELTEMSSIAGRATPTITYVGRLKDSRKGLEVFFDALELVWATRPDVQMRIWVIGGSPAELHFAERSAMSRQHIAEEARKNALTFWGRVDHNSLPEFYSRSTVVVLPSFREQFGMVAAEAMMCGSAVVASRVGGLQDVVVSGHTGMLFDAGNAAALAACILSYINVTELSAWHGSNASVWARERFDSARVLPMVEAILRSLDESVLSDYAETSETAFMNRSIRDLSVTAERLLGRKTSRYRNLTSSHSLSFRLDLDDGESVFAKQYSRRPPSLHTIYGDDAEPRLRDPATYRLNLMSRLANLPYVPAVLAHDHNSGMIIQKWVDAAPVLSFSEAGQVLSLLQDKIIGTELLPKETLDVFEDSAATLASGSLHMTSGIQRSFDRLGAELHSPLHDGVLACRRMHPQVELFRIAKFLERNRVWLPQNYAVRALSETRRMLSLKPFLVRRPAFAHGSLKAEHILGDPENYFLCDFDQAGYYVGPVDTAHWLWEYFERQPEAARESTFIDALLALVDDEEDLYLAICWVLALLLNKDFVFVMRGEWGSLQTSMRALWTFGDAVRSLELFG